MNSKLECFGEIYPDLNRISYNQPVKGKVFSVSVRSAGIGIQGTETSADIEAWEACRQCTEYDSCYDFSTARFLLSSKVK